SDGIFDLQRIRKKPLLEKHSDYHYANFKRPYLNNHWIYFSVLTSFRTGLSLQLSLK
ncbi:4934_t:CDS:1, partial [Racocetra persica]